ncbi:hypothetical protein ACHAXR_002260, partial [Thalassiosira sp. AJA248-18]
IACNWRRHFSTRDSKRLDGDNFEVVYHWKLSTFLPSLTLVMMHLYGCSNLREVVLNEGLEKIGQYSFNCKSLESIKIPSTVSEVGFFFVLLQVNEELKKIERGAF